MPLVKIEIIKGKTQDYKNTLFEAVFEGFSNAISVPRENLYSRIYEMEDGNYERRPGRSDKYTVIEVNMLPNRDAMLKKSLIQEITRSLGESLRIAPEEIFIIINDPPLENWGHKGLPANEWF